MDVTNFHFLLLDEDDTATVGNAIIWLNVVNFQLILDFFTITTNKNTRRY
jgi:hypothetical protein